MSIGCRRLVCSKLLLITNYLAADATVPQQFQLSQQFLSIKVGNKQTRNLERVALKTVDNLPTGA